MLITLVLVSDPTPPQDGTLMLHQLRNVLILTPALTLTLPSPLSDLSPHFSTASMCIPLRTSRAVPFAFANCVTQQCNWQEKPGSQAACMLTWYAAQATLQKGFTGEANPSPNPNPDSDPKFNPHTNPHPDSHPNPNSDPDPDPVSDPDPDPDLTTLTTLTLPYPYP